MKRLNKKGFTLVELLAVIVILALLMVVAASTIGSAQDNAKKSSLQTEAKKIKTSIENDAKSALLLHDTLTTDDFSSFTGKDGNDYIYDIIINPTKGTITSFKICYRTEFVIVDVETADTVDIYDANNTDKACTATGSVTIAST